MAWNTIGGSDLVKDSRAELNENFELLRTTFIGTSFPASPAEGQLCMRSDTGLLYRCSDATTPVWEVVNLSYFLALAGGTMTGLLKLAKGASKAAAATLNLSNRTGNFLHITGNTGITTITIDAGDVALLWFDGTPTITLSSSLLGPVGYNSGSIAMAVNDMAIVVGDGSSVARIAAVFRVSGNAVNDTRYMLADGTRAFADAPLVTGEGRVARPASGSHADSGKISWGTDAPGTLAEGQMYLRHS